MIFTFAIYINYNQSDLILKHNHVLFRHTRYDLNEIISPKYFVTTKYADIEGAKAS